MAEEEPREKVPTWWFPNGCPLTGGKSKDGCNARVFKSWYCCSQLTEEHARLMLWLHLARSGKHYGKHTAEELFEICSNWPIKVGNSELWQQEEKRHIDDFLPQTNEEALELYKDFGDDDYKGNAEEEDNVVQGAGVDMSPFSSTSGLSKEVQDLVLQAAKAAAERAFNLQQSVHGKAPGAVPSDVVAVARRYGAESLDPDMCIISKQLLSGIVDAMERSREQLESAKAFFEGGKQHFQREMERFNDALKYLKLAQRRAEGSGEGGSGSSSRAEGSSGRGPIGAASTAAVPYRSTYNRPRTPEQRAPPRGHVRHARTDSQARRSRSRTRAAKKY